jgi:hypothetical protein
MAGSRRLDINLFFDHSESDRQQAAARAKTKQVADQMISDADAAEKAKLEFVKRANAQKVAELAKASKTEIELAKEAAAASTRADKEAAAAKTKSDKETAAAKIKSDKEAADSAIRLAREEMNSKRFAAREAARFAKEQEAAQRSQNSAVRDSISGIVSMGAAMLGLKSAQEVTSAFVGQFDKISQFAFKTAEDILKMRGAVRELAALRGELGSTGPTAAHVFDMQAKTLLSTEDATAMEQEALGVGELAIGKTTSREDFMKALESTGKLATMEGGSAKAYGALQGQLYLQADHQMSPEELQARMERMRHIIQPGAFSSLGQAQEQFGEMNGLVQNGIVSSEQGMGMLSAFSLSSKGQAGTMANQFVRATLGNQIRARGGAVSPELETEKTYEYMKELGVDKTNDPFVIGGAIAADIKKRQATEKDFSPYRHLQLHGFGNQQDRDVLMTFAGLTNNGRYQKIKAAQDEALAIGAPGQGVTDARFADRVAKDPFLLNRQAETLNQLGKAKVGLSEEPLLIAQRAAHARLVARGEYKGDFEEWRTTGTFARVAHDAVAGGYDPRTGHEVNTYRSVDDELKRTLGAEAKRLDIPTPVGYFSRFSTEGQDRELAQKISDRGGNLSGDMARDLKDIAASLKKIADQAENRPTAPAGVPAPIQGKPNQPRLRP